MPNRSLGLLLIAIAGFTTSVAQAQQPWALAGTKIYPAPDVPPIRGTVVIAGSKIQSVMTGESRATPATMSSRCDGGVIMAGFQNSHVHFTGEEFSNARLRPAAELDAALTRMLTRYGYTTVFDVASEGDNTLALRNRIENGELRGPRILTVGLALFPPNGLPVYISHMPKELLETLPQPASVDEAVQIVRRNLSAGLDATKLFIVTPQGNGTTKRMPADIASAAVKETHRRGKLVFAHPTDIRGIQDALAAHVDILTHPPLGAPAPWPEALMKQMREAGMSMTPTLQLFPYELDKQQVPPAIAEKLITETVTEFGKFAALGGQVLFGTDVGYMTDYDPTREYELLAAAGMTPMQILASLTTTPAARWNEQTSRGRIAPEMAADLVVLDADPSDSPRNFASVRCAIRGGEIIYSRQ